MESSLAAVYACLAILVTVYLVRWRTSPLYSIPTLGGPSIPGLSFLSAINFLCRADKIIDEGYRKFRGSAFKVALFDRWLVIVSGLKMVDELRRRSDEELSFVEGVQTLLLFKYTIGRESVDDAYHIDLIKDRLMRALQTILPEVIDELQLAVQQRIPTKGDEWVSVNVMKSMQQIVARASNRAFVGLPACRDQEFLDLVIQFAIDVMTDRVVVGMFPKFLKPAVGYMVSSARQTIDRAQLLLQPIINERRANMAEAGEAWSDKPNDMLQWIIEEAAIRNASDSNIVERVLITNIAAIHTSSNTIAHVLYDLAAHEEYFPPLRKEIESILATHGWTKAAMGKMWKLDSLLKETQRHHGISLTAMTRKAMKDVTLNDGTFIPKDTMIVAAAQPMHRDETNYSDADTYDPFRFSRMREVEGEDVKHQFVNTSVDYLVFGHGKHACPGRFFAANELKAILAYIILNYDLKLGGDGKRPENVQFLLTVVPPVDGELLFRKRQTV